ncbi:hypothetical protein [Streptomyces sp. NPDC010273]|uniref:hypothetical protein n=1 Tax=Streptomyces sp. NPDC010273 TaxID=3364829 RepID=UPI0036F08DF3
MSEYSFGYDDTDDTSGLGETNDQQQGPKWFREGLAKLSGQVNELKAENDRLKAAQTRSQLEDTLKAKGYAPQAAGLFQGDPAKLDEWLTANNAALARLPEGQSQGEQQQTQQGPPPTTVPAEGQEQLQRLQNQGTQGVAPPQGSDKEQAAALAAITDPKAFAEYMAANGNPFDWS